MKAVLPNQKRSLIEYIKSSNNPYDSLNEDLLINYPPGSPYPKSLDFSKFNVDSTITRDKILFVLFKYPAFFNKLIPTDVEYILSIGNLHEEKKLPFLLRIIEGYHTHLRFSASQFTYIIDNTHSSEIKHDGYFIIDYLISQRKRLCLNDSDVCEIIHKIDFTRFHLNLRYDLLNALSINNITLEDTQPIKKAIVNSCLNPQMCPSDVEHIYKKFLKSIYVPDMNTKDKRSNVFFSNIINNITSPSWFYLELEQLSKKYDYTYLLDLECLSQIRMSIEQKRGLEKILVSSSTTPKKVLDKQKI